MSVESFRLAEVHRLAQHRLGVETVGVLGRVFPLLDLTNLDATTVTWLRAVVPLVVAQHRRSAGLAAGYVRAARFLDVGPSAYLAPAAVAQLDQIATSLRVTGPIEARRLSALGIGASDLRRAVFASSSSSGMRLALQGGRDTVMAAVAGDDRALGYARVGSASPCAFCSMLISRGPVYSQGTVDFQAHDRCSCGARPVYRRADGWSDQARQLQELWQGSTAGESGRAAINAFRRAVEAA
jgi:hypothetical protein